MRLFLLLLAWLAVLDGAEMVGPATRIAFEEALTFSGLTQAFWV